MALQHLHLHVRSRERAEKYYSDWFAMRVKRRGSEITFMNDEDKFLLALADDEAPAPMPDWFHFGFEFDSLRSVLDLAARMQAAGLSLRKPLYQDESFASFRCVDPDGHVIEVYWDGRTA